LIEKNKKNTDYYYLRATCYAQKKDIPNALIDINKVVKLAPKNPDSYFKRLKIYDLIHASKDIIGTDLQKIERLSSKNDTEALLEMYYQYNFYTDVVRIANKILASNPNNMNVNYKMAYANANLKLYPSALEHLNKYSDNDDSMDKEYYKYLGISKLGVAGRENKELIQSAISDLTKSIESNVDVPTCYLYRGSAKIIIEDYESGYKDIQKYISMTDVPDTLAYHQMGYAELMAIYKSAKYDSKGKFIGYPTLAWENDVDEYDIILNRNPKDVSAIINSYTDNIELLRNAISALKSQSNNLALLKKTKINDSQGNRQIYITTSPYINALGDEGKGTVDTNLIILDLYKQLLSLELNDATAFSKLKDTDVNDFYANLLQIDNDDAISMMYMIVPTSTEIIDNYIGSKDDVLKTSKEFYLKTTSYLEDRQLCSQSATTKKIMMYSYASLGALAYNQHHDINTMKDYLDKAISYGYSKSLAYTNIASAYSARSSYFEAIEYYTKALSVKKDKKIFYERGRLRENNNDYSGALSDYGNAIKLDNNYSDAIWARANIYFTRNQFAQATTDLKRYISLNPNDAVALYNLAVCLYNQKQKKSAYTYCSKAKIMFEEQSDETGYNKCVRMMNKINGYYD
jgi:tetratricopeptide (TPR) repeat protein